MFFFCAAHGTTHEGSGWQCSLLLGGSPTSMSFQFNLHLEFYHLNVTVGLRSTKFLLTCSQRVHWRVITGVKKLDDAVHPVVASWTHRVAGDIVLTFCTSHVECGHTAKFLLTYSQGVCWRCAQARRSSRTQCALFLRVGSIVWSSAFAFWHRRTVARWALPFCSRGTHFASCSLQSKMRSPWKPPASRHVSF